ncbi:MAG: hypothetical protein LBP43_03285 [Treponema sp.]|jgi:hypothetical protein|nr:hypothetical protein [Treponema sp.]
MSEAQQTASPFYAILAVYIPFSVLGTLLPLCNLLLPPSFSLPLGVLFISAAVCALVASIFHALMYNVRTGYTAANIRGIVIILVLTYALVSVCDFSPPGTSGPGTEGPLNGLFLPRLANVLAPPVVLYVWLSVIFLKRVLGGREVFETYTHQYRGMDLQRILLEDADFMSEADARFGKTIGIYIFQLFLAGALTAAAAILGRPLPLSLFIALLILFINAAFIFALFGLFRQEHYYAGEGIALAAPDRSKRIIAMFMFPLVTGLGALLFASEKSILPFSWITGFLSWIAALLARLSRPADEEAPVIPELPDFMERPSPMNPFAEMMEPVEPWPFWDWLKYGAIALGILAFLWFMVKPLFSRDRNQDGLSFGERLRRLIIRWFQALRSGTALFWTSLFGGSRQVKIGAPNAAEIRRLSTELLSGFSSAKKREMRRSVTLFARLILWGNSTYQAPWKPSNAPGEYCALLASRITATASTGPSRSTGPAGASGPEDLPRAVIRCGELFEQALYSEQVLTGEERREFTKLVEGITRG